MNYVILSQGAYSDYSPDYYVGEQLITQEDLDKKGREVGDMILAEYEANPERPHISEYSWDREITERYNPDTGERVTTYEHGDKWIEHMITWLNSLGFTKLPSAIPEININYGDMPHN